VIIKTGESYEKQAADLEIGADKSASAVKSSQSIRIDGAVVSDLTAYNLGGNNFFKLTEPGEKLGFDVKYDAAANTMVVTGK